MGLEMVKGVKDDVPAFLDYLFDGLEGYVCVAGKKVLAEGHSCDKVCASANHIKFSREGFQWPVAKDVVSDWILSNTTNVEVYVAPAIFSAPTGRREDFKATNVVWTEFDGALPTGDILSSIPEPTLRVRSSGEGHEHWYWKLAQPLTTLDTVEGITRSLTYQLGGDPSAWDAGQVLRPPATHNHKRDKPVYIVAQSEGTVSPVLFDSLPAVTQAVVDVSPDTIPDVTEVVLAYAWPKDAATLYRSKVEPGSDRSSMLMRLGYYLAEMGLSDAEMFSVLRNADDRWGKFKDRTDRNRRLSDLIAKTREKYPSEIFLTGDEVAIYGLQSFLNTEVEIEWLIPGLLQRAGYMLLTGPSGVGKTQWSLRWAINLALGRPFLGFDITEPRKILFWSLEMGHTDLKMFLKTMCTGMSQEDLLLLEENLLIAPLGESFYLDVEKTQQQFEQILTDFPVDGVFIDSLGSSAAGAITDELTVRKIMDFNDHIRNKYNVFTWFIHHMRKAQGDNKKPNKQADVYGNIYMVNRATSVYCLWPASGHIEVIPLKKRLAPQEDPWHVTRFSNLDFIRKENVSLAVDKGGPKIDLELEAPSSTIKGMDF